jgi:hypothetical protein
LIIWLSLVVVEVAAQAAKEVAAVLVDLELVRLYP